MHIFYISTYVFVVCSLNLHLPCPYILLPSATDLMLYFTLYQNSLEFAQWCFGKYLTARSLKSFFKSFFMVSVNFQGIKTLWWLKLLNLTSLNTELEEKHSMIQWAHRSWSQHTTVFVYVDHLYFSCNLLDLLQIGFCSQYSIKNTIPNVINSVLNLFRFSEAAFVSIDQCLFLWNNVLFCPGFKLSWFLSYFCGHSTFVTFTGLYVLKSQDSVKFLLYYTYFFKYLLLIGQCHLGGTALRIGEAIWF